MKKIITISILLMACTFNLFAQEQVKVSTADRGDDKVYIYKTSGGEERKMEVYFPPNYDPKKSKVPGIILFHGGAWLGGSLAEFRRTCAYFASRGLVCATANYQMLKISKAEAGKLCATGDTHKRVCVIDAKSAIRWFKQHADEFGIDPNRIITGGTSAGGHISALATMNADLNDPSDPMDIDTSVVAYIWVNPAFSRADHRSPEIYLMDHLKADLAPSIVFWGENDNWKKGWDIAYAKWKSLGVKNIEVKIAQNEDHGFWNHQEQWQRAMLIETDKFLIKHGFLSGQPTLKMPENSEKFTFFNTNELKKLDNSSTRPTPRNEAWLKNHAKREKNLRKKEKVDILLIGDSITHGWNKHEKILSNLFAEEQVLNLGNPADKTENIIWRLEHHTLDKITPKVAVVLAGTNNSNNDEYTDKEIAEGVETIIQTLLRKLPETKILLLGIFPRGSYDQRTKIKRGLKVATMNAQWEKITRVNKILETLADGDKIIYLNINQAFLNENGALPISVMPDLLHLNEKGYSIWAKEMFTTLTKIMEK